MKNKFVSILAAATVVLFALSSCQSSPDNGDKTTGSESSTVSIIDVIVPNIVNISNEDFLDIGETVDFSKTSAADYAQSPVYIYLSDNNVKTSGSSVTVDDNFITINDSGSYVISGSLSDGQIIVDAGKDDEVTLIFYNASIACSHSAALYVKKAGHCTLLPADGTKNVLSDGAEYIYASEDDDEPSAAIYSKSDLTVCGGGELYIYANYNDALESRDALAVEGGSIIIKSVDDGIIGKDSVSISGGSVVIVCEGDGIKSTNTEDANCGSITVNVGSISISSAQDGMDAAADVIIDGGIIDILSGGGSTGDVKQDNDRGRPGGFFGGFNSSSSDNSDTVSRKGIKGDTGIKINDGAINISAADDAFHTNGSISIAEGTVVIASNDDGIHADATVNISGGNIAIATSYEGMEGYDINISGGSINVFSSDDGININSEETGMGGGLGRGGQPAVTSPSQETGALRISGGTLVINAGGDGFDSNGNIYMTDGTVVVHGPTSNANGAIDYGTEFVVSGGTFIAAGAVGMAEAPSELDGQGCVNVYTDGSEGTVIEIRNASGEAIMTYSGVKTFGSIVMSCPEIISDETYTIYKDGDEYMSFTASSSVVSFGSSQSGFGGFGGFGGNDQSEGGRPNNMPPPPAGRP